MKHLGPILLLLTAGTLAAGCSVMSAFRRHAPPDTDELVGAWRSKVQFTGGVFATIKDLEFTYVFNAGGTMTESSNYDGAPPVPPAYGAWRWIAPRQFEARYTFTITKPPPRFGEITAGGGWLPAGYGVLTEQIALGTDGKTFTSHLKYEAFDRAGRPAGGGGEAEGKGVRLGF